MTAPCGSFCHAFDNRSLHFVNWEETLIMAECLLKRAPQMASQVNRVQIRAIRWTKCSAHWTEGSHTASFCVSGGVRGNTVLLQWPFVTATSHLDVGFFAKHHVTMVCNFPPGWMKTTSALPMRNTATDTVALRLQYSHSHCQTSGVDFFLKASDE